MTWDKGKIIWIAVGLPLLVGSTLILSWSVLTRHADKFVMSRVSDQPAGRLEELPVGSESPDFSAIDLEGRQIALSEFKDRKMVILYFWVLECDLCLAAMPTIESIHHVFEDRAVEILAVNVGENRDEVRRFHDREKYTFRMVADEDRIIGKLFGVGEVPALVVVGRDGRVVRTQVGDSPSTADELLRVLGRLSEEPRSGTHEVVPATGRDPRPGPGPAASTTEPGVASSGGRKSPIQSPRLLYKIEPSYTDEARAAKIEGTVELEGEIWEDGKMHNIRVVRSLDHGLDESAKEAVKKWRFAPGQRDGKAVRRTARIQVRFRLV